MDKRYQIFISSTYVDLKEERRAVIQTIMEMDCIPAGMELFPAVDEEQFEFIKKVIDDCDYYLLIIGGRYGSTTEEGISYTEKEYDYAVEKGLKVISLIHECPDDLPLKKSDTDQDLRDRLTAFRDKAKKDRLAKFWGSAEELPGKVAISLTKTIKMYPATGWVRANVIPEKQLLLEVNELRKENDQLKSQLNKIANTTEIQIDNLAGLDELFTVSGSVYDLVLGNTVRSWKANVTWKQIFSYIAPCLLRHQDDNAVRGELINALKVQTNGIDESCYIDSQIFHTITLQLKALGLINTKEFASTLHWSLTPKGESLMMQLHTVRKN